MRRFLAHAASARVARRALGYAVVVGAVLVAINHADAILEGRVERGRLLKMGLTVLVPYLVSTFSSAAALVEAERERAGDSRG